MQCPNCKTELEPGESFCGGCGQAVTAIEPPTVANTPSVCATCGAALSPGKKFCGACGQAALPPTPMPQLCPNCHKPLGKSLKFCEECGAALDIAAAQSATYQSPPATFHPPIQPPATPKRSALPYALAGILGIAVLAVLGYVGYQYLSGSGQSSGIIIPKTDIPLDHGGSASAVAFLPDGKTLISAGSGQVKFWELQTGKLLKTQTPGGNDYVAISPNGKLLATAHEADSGSFEDSVKLSEIQSGKQLRTFTGVEAVDLLAFSPDGKTLAVGSNTSMTLRVWNVETGSELMALVNDSSGTSEHRSVSDKDKIYSLSFSPDGQTLAGGGGQFVVTTGEKKPEVGRELKWMAFSPDGKVLAGCRDEGITLWNAHTLEKQATLAGCDEITALAFSPDSRLLASGCVESGEVKLWDGKTGQLKRALRWPNKEVISIAFSSDGKILATGSRDGTVRLWSL